MDQHESIAAIAWIGFQASIVALIAGLLAQLRGRRNLALALFAFAVAWLLFFSFLGGFSIGRFTTLIPVIVLGYVVGMGRGPAAVAGSLLGAALVYTAFSWLFYAPIAGAIPLLFSAWAIPFYAILGLAAFVWSLLSPPRQVVTGIG